MWPRRHDKQLEITVNIAKKGCAVACIVCPQEKLSNTYNLYPESELVRDLTFDDFKAHIRRSARQADELTAEYAKKFGLDLDKEHMAAIGNKATDDGRSQFPGSATYNRRMGKLDSFSKAVMEILGLPGAGDSVKAAKIKGKGPRATATRQQYEQSGWWKSYTDWAATDGASLDDMSKWNPGDILTDSDKLKIQRAFGKNQADVAQQILAERQIAEAARRAGLLDEPDEIALVKKLLKRINSQDYKISILVKKLSKN